MKRKASAVWHGGLKDGKGTLSNTQYSFSTRFRNGMGTNPKELIAAAHAGCFSMALSGQASIVAYAMVQIARQNVQGVNTVPSWPLQAIPGT